jgi:DNA-binding IscR family transcriptional regulator
VALQLCVAIARAQSAGATGCSRFALSSEFRLSDDAIRVLLERLEEHRVLQANRMDDNWSLAKDSTEINVQHIFDAFQKPGQPHSADPCSDEPVEQVLAALLRDSRKPLEDRSIDDILIEILAADVDATQAT